MLSIANIMETVRQWRTPLLEITGGEPLLQSGCAALATTLLEEGRTVLVETNGSLPIGILPKDVIRIMDVKCPGSGMSDSMDWSNMEALNDRDEVKFVLSGRSDYDWACNVIQRYSLASRCRAVLFSAVAPQLTAAQLAAWMLADAIPARLQVQLHKVIWPTETRGV